VSTMLETDRGRLIVRIPRTSAAEIEQSGELLGRTALTQGTRTLLPFTAPETLGLTRAGDSRAVVSTYLDGEHFSVNDLSDDSLLLQSLAEAISAIHNLPRSTVREAGLAHRTASEVRAASARLVERAESTRMLPATVSTRWAEVLRATDLWEFDPTVVHGSLDDTQLLVANEQVVGVLGWSDLHIGDPAIDFAWLAGAGRAVLTVAIDRYAKLRDSADRDRLSTRAAFAHELDVARWLLHGVELHDQGIIDDAVAMLDRLVDSLPLRPEPLLPHTVLDIAEVGDLLGGTPDLEERAQDTSTTDVFDDERVFFADTDFIEPLGVTTTPDAAETGVVPDFDRTGAVSDLRSSGEVSGVPQAKSANNRGNSPATDSREFAFDPLVTGPIEPFDFDDLGKPGDDGDFGHAGEFADVRKFGEENEFGDFGDFPESGQSGENPRDDPRRSSGPERA
jgi:macrolide phosphotransferase